ncbi:MAG: succinate dehydrogenase, hydrophobic membrane anchor protein [Alphaproteobacteria bacterium]|nr:succinate dehydrogenase, hydrophobic membrane anchor protein [Alphaproteobacteria bacterium]
MSYKTDFKAATGLGSAKDGTGHWISQRLTAMALIPLGLAFLYPFATSIGAGYSAVHQTYSHPFNALVAIGFINVLFRHLRLGLQVVIEDYVHGSHTRLATVITNALVWRAFAVAGVFAIAKIAFGA